MVSKIDPSGKPKRPKTGGRQPGTPNKATACIRDIARQYTDDAVNALSSIVTDESQPAAARVSAAKEILDRAYGKSTQIIAGDKENPLESHVVLTNAPESVVRYLAGLADADAR